MRIGLIDGPGHHGRVMRERLAALGHEVVYTSWHPRFAAQAGGRDLTRRRDGLLYDGARRVAASVRHRLGLTTAYELDVQTRLYGRLAAKYVADCDVVIAFSFVAAAALERAPRVILELPATHLATHQAIVDAELARAGRRGAQRFSRFAIARVTAEYARARTINVLSSYAKQTLVDRGVPADKVIVSPLGVDTQRFAPGPPRAAPRPFRVLYAGRIELAKGVRYLVEAFDELRLRDAELLLVGSLHDDARPFVRGHAVRAPMAPEALAALYREVDVVAFPTLTDGLGLVMLEAMASGVPVVATHRSGAPDVIRDGEDGFVVPSGSAEALADKLAWLYRHPDARAAMGRSAHARIHAEFTLARYGERLARLLDGAAPRARDGSRGARRENAPPPCPR